MKTSLLFVILAISVATSQSVKAQTAPIINNVIGNDEYRFKKSPPANRSACGNEMSSVECQVFTLTNKVRELRKLKPLRYYKNCYASSLNHSEYMARQSSAGQSLAKAVNHDLFKERIKKFKVGGHRVTENVAGGNPKRADELFKGWMSSEKHRSNILDPKANSMAVASANDKQGGQFWTQCFSSF